MSAIYDRIGKTYTATRKADPRIARHLKELLQLPPGSRLIDVGAGSGNYSFALAEMGYRITAVEP
ncbi:MAG: class I SAM-dependent methyltransferase, partial [Gammaproteobacteria bacterium]